MIVRILGEGQYDVDDAAIDRLNALDSAVEAAVQDGDESAFRNALAELLSDVRGVGTPHDSEALDTSDVVLPPEDASLDDVREMLGDEGLIPG